MYKGLLKKHSTGWNIEYIQKSRKTNDKLLTIELHPSQYDSLGLIINNKRQILHDEITEVEFDYVNVCTNCGQENCDNLACRGHKDVKYALIYQKEDDWDDIEEEFCLDKENYYPDFQTFTIWLKDNFEPPKRIKK